MCMSYRQRLSLFILIDSCIALTAIFIGLFLSSANAMLLELPLISLFAIILGHHLFALKWKLYKKVWEYASVGELLIIFKVVTASMLFAMSFQLIVMRKLSFKLYIIIWLLQLLLIGGSRFFWRMHHDSLKKQEDDRQRTLIIGAGSAGTMVARQLLKNSSHLLPVAFIDDNKDKQGLDILGLPVVGSVQDIVNITDGLDIDFIVISIPTLSKRELQTIYQQCARTKVQTKTLPLLEDIVTGKVSVTQFRDVQVEDLLGRDPVALDIRSIDQSVTGKVVLITGAGGSIGSEISRQISKFMPRKLILLGHGENSIYDIEMELLDQPNNTGIEVITEIADIKDQKKMMSIMSLHKPDLVYHAAAHKHVPLMERNPEEALKNNMIGTKNVAEAARWNNVSVFVMISTDKAVHPTSVMGASKRLAEMIIQHMNENSQTKFVAVRFGNVLGSRGSVIPLFKKQIEKGGPVTITHPDMVRYFMTIPEASKLVIQAGALANGGEIFVLDMGDPVKIVELAENLIKLSGYTIDEIGLSYTGIRPGEKLFEELLTKDEVHEQQLYPKIYIGKTTNIFVEDLEELMMTYINLDRDTLRKKLLYLANRDVMNEPKSALII